MIVITTPTGDIGHQVLDNILKTATAGEHIRVIIRDPATLPVHTRDHVEVVQGSHSDHDVVTQAFAGADSVFWLTPPDPTPTASPPPTSTSPDRRARRSRPRASSGSSSSRPWAAGHQGTRTPDT